MRWMALCPVLALISCEAPDWRAAAAERALDSVRRDVGDPAVRFFAVQVVGDDRTGQICGRLMGEGLSTRRGTPARFIVYIDNSAGPWIENQIGHDIVSDARFDFAWENDCVKEGWREGA